MDDLTGWLFLPLFVFLMLVYRSHWNRHLAAKHGPFRFWG